MRGTWIVVALFACHHADAPAPAAPQAPTPCARTADSMVAAMLAGLPANEASPTETADAVRNLIRQRCEQDAWSDEATRCLIAMKHIEDAEPCARFMTAPQQAALVRDERAQFGATPVDVAPAAEAAPAAPAAEAAPAPAPGAPPPAPAKTMKPKANRAPGDPCSGGE
jgi:pyruvate dehydrogenase E2 component (dihydrolipoamide acetyltransferase)